MINIIQWSASMSVVVTKSGIFAIDSFGIDITDLTVMSPRWAYLMYSGSLLMFFNKVGYVFNSTLDQTKTFSLAYNWVFYAIQLKSEKLLLLANKNNDGAIGVDIYDKKFTRLYSGTLIVLTNHENMTVCALEFGGFAFAYFSEKTLKILQYDDFAHQLNSVTITATSNVIKMNMTSLENGGIAVAYLEMNSNLTYFTLNGLFQASSPKISIRNVTFFELYHRDLGYFLIHSNTKGLYLNYLSVYSAPIISQSFQNLPYDNITYPLKSGLFIEPETFLIYSRDFTQTFTFTLACAKNFYVQPSKNANYQTSTGNYDDPFDSIWNALSQPLDSAPFLFIHLLKDSSLPHYLMAGELEEDLSLRYPLTSSNGEVTLPIVTIKPLYCDELVVSHYPSLLRNCSQRNESITIFLKSKVKISTTDLELENVIIDGLENIEWLNYQTDPAQVKNCTEKRIKCCDPSSMLNSVYSNLKCFGNLELDLYPVITPKKFFEISATLKIQNSEFKNINDYTIDSLFTMGRTTGRINIIDSNFSKNFFRSGTIKAEARVYVSIQNIVFKEYNNWPLVNKATNLNIMEGYLIISKGISDVLISDSIFNNNGFQLQGCEYDNNTYAQSYLFDLRKRAKDISIYTSSLILVNAMRNVTISRSKFNNTIGKIGSVFYTNTTDKLSYVVISDCDFDRSFASVAFSNFFLLKNYWNIAEMFSIRFLRNSFKNSYGCLRSYGNIFLGVKTSPTSEFVDLNSDQNVWTYHKQFYVEFTENNFTENLQSVSNSICAIGIQNFRIQKGFFISNGGPSGSLGYSNLISSPFAQKYAIPMNNNYTNWTQVQSTVIYLDYVSINVFVNLNHFEKNWGPFDGALSIGEIFTIKSFQGWSVMMFDDNNFVNHDGGRSLGDKINLFGGNALFTYSVQVATFRASRFKFQFTNCKFNNITVAFNFKNSSTSKQASILNANQIYQVSLMKYLDPLVAKETLISNKNDYPSGTYHVNLQFYSSTFINISHLTNSGSLFLLAYGNFNFQNCYFGNITNASISLIPRHNCDTNIFYTTFENIVYSNEKDNGLFSYGPGNFRLLNSNLKNIDLGSHHLIDAQIRGLSFTSVIDLTNFSNISTSAQNLMDITNNYANFTNLQFNNTNSVLKVTDIRTMYLANVTFSGFLYTNSIPLILKCTSLIGIVRIWNVSLQIPVLIENSFILSITAYSTEIINSTFIYKYTYQETVFSVKTQNFLVKNNYFYNSLTSASYTIFDLSGTQGLVYIAQNVFYSPGMFLSGYSMNGDCVIHGNNFFINNSQSLISILQSSRLASFVAQNNFLWNTVPLKRPYPEYLLLFSDTNGYSVYKENVIMNMKTNRAIFYFHSSITAFNFSMEANLFSGNTGTPVYLQSINNQNSFKYIIPTANITKNVFVKNSAPYYNLIGGYGGAITIKSDDYSIQQVQINENFFLENEADYLGGAIYTNWNLPQFDEKNIFINNSASNIENNIFSFPSYLRFFIDQEIQNLVYIPNGKKDLPQFDRKIFWSEFPSGIDSKFNLTILVVDAYGQICMSDTSFLVLNSPGVTTAEIPKKIATYSIKSVEGVYFFKTINFRFPVQSSQKIFFNSTDVALIAHPQVNISFDIELEVSFRNCMDGEYILPDQSCQQCAQNYWLPALGNNSKGPCTLCDLQILTCNGGADVGVNPGYWIYNTSSNNPIQCPFEEACLGNPHLFLEWGNMTSRYCAEGYKGNLCSNCEKGYGKYGSSPICSDCQNDVTYYLKLAVSSLISIMVYVYGIRETIKGLKKSSQSKGETRSVYVRILMNYVQMILQVNGMDIQMPKLMGNVFAFAGEIAAGLQTSLSYK